MSDASAATTPPGPAGQAAREVVSGRPQRTAQWWLGWVSLVALIAFCTDAFLVINGAVTQSFALPAASRVQSVHWGPITTLMELTNASDGLGQVVLGVVVVVGLFIWDRRAG